MVKLYHVIPSYCSCGGQAVGRPTPWTVTRVTEDGDQGNRSGDRTSGAGVIPRSVDLIFQEVPVGGWVKLHLWPWHAMAISSEMMVIMVSNGFHSC